MTYVKSTTCKSCSLMFSKSKKQQLTLIITNPYQVEVSTAFTVADSPDPLFPHLSVKEKSGLATDTKCGCVYPQRF